MKEVEILYNLKGSFKEARKQLSIFKYAGKDVVTDLYYKMPDRTCLRLRKNVSGVHLTYKKDIYKGNAWLYSEEQEVKVKDFKKMRKLMKNIFQEWLIMQIDRTIYKNKKYKIVLDKIENVGNFLEVESREDVKDVEITKQNIRKFVSKMGLQVEEIVNDKGKPEIVAETLCL